MTLVRALTCVGVMVLAGGCSAASPDEATLEVDAAQTVVDGRSALPELADAGIVIKAAKLVDPRFKNLSEPEDRYYLDVRLGKLSRAQFDRVKALFGGHTRVPYDAARVYELTDFLHPAMQAVVNQTYTRSDFSGMDLLEHAAGLGLEEDETFHALAKNGLAVQTNCYNTTAEIVRMLRPGSEQSYNLYFPDRFEAHTWFSDDTFSEKVDEAHLAPGDVLVVGLKGEAQKPMLAHTAIVISKELVFEKTDASSDDPYRVSLRKDVLAKYNRIGAEEGGPNIEYRRFNGAGKSPIPAKAVPTNELEAKYKNLLKKAYPSLNPENVTMSFDMGMGGVNDPQPNEIQPSTVVINPRTGRGILKADQKTLRRFVGLTGR